MAEPSIVAVVGAVLVSWHPERGWLCSATGHHMQPCEHTAGLTVTPSPAWCQ